MKRNLLRPLFMVFLALILGGCSLAGLGYKYADWLIKRKIMEIVKLYSPQQDRLEAILEEYMIWHKKEMLPQYQQILSETHKRVLESQKKPITAEEFENFLLNTRELYDASFRPLTYQIAPILSELGEEQVDRTQALLNKRLEEFKEKAEESPADRLKELQEGWRDNLKEYLGKLNPEQEKLILEYTPKMVASFSHKARFARGVSQMKEFLNIYHDLPLKGGKPTDVLKAREERLLSFFKSWGKESDYKSWRKVTSEFLTKLSFSLDQEQRTNFANVLDSWTKKVQEMRNET